ncbi:MAG TPA: hypothetical protein VMR21_12580, partial [Vicinamibacteria bacterium]|nr:hypothetical protein [Vicinamibacteria bacterium]
HHHHHHHPAAATAAADNDYDDHHHHAAAADSLPLIALDVLESRPHGRLFFCLRVRTGQDGTQP